MGHSHHHHEHNHKHGHGAHQHAESHTVLVVCLVLTLAFAAVEAVAGFWGGSLALLGDAGHMVTDASALGLAALGMWIAKRPPSARHSFGLVRAEVMIALFNALFMLAVVGVIAVEAMRRLQHPQPVQGSVVMWVAAAGLAVNLLVAYLLTHGEDSLNVRAALLHVLGDVLGSVAALLSGLVIYLTGWMPIDPILSLFIVVLILVSTFRLLREVLHVLMEGVPLNLDLPEIGQAMAQVGGVISVHDLHVWTLRSGSVALSAHVVIGELQQWPDCLSHLREVLHERYGIEHVTLQPEITTFPLVRRERPV